MLGQMRRRFVAYTLADPRENAVFFAAYGSPTEAQVLVTRVRRAVTNDQPIVRPTLAGTLRDARIADILATGAEPTIGVLVNTESRAEAARRAAEAVAEHGLSVQRRERGRRPHPVVGSPLTTKAVALLLLAEEGPFYAMMLVRRAVERWGVEVEPEAARVALIGLEVGGHVESHQRPNDTLIGRPRAWYVLTDKGRRAADKVRETVRAVAA
jgi:hypothetical protein